MKVKKLLITGIAVLGLVGVGKITANADPTPAETRASEQVDNALIQKYGNHVPDSASLAAERKLNEEFGPSQATKSMWNATVGQQKHTTFDKYYNSNKQANNTNASQNESNSNTKSNNGNTNKQNKSKIKPNKKANKSHKKSKDKSPNHKTNSAKESKNKLNHHSSHHYLGIGIGAVVIIAIIGLACMIFSKKRKH